MLSTEQVFETWLQLRLNTVEDEFDGELLDHCERAVLAQPIDGDLAAVQVGTVLRVMLEDGEVNGGHAIEAMDRLLGFVAARGEVEDPLPLVRRVIDPSRPSADAGVD